MNCPVREEREYVMVQHVAQVPRIIQGAAPERTHFTALFKAAERGFSLVVKQLEINIDALLKTNKIINSDFKT